MEFIVKKFNELNIDELFEIYRLRSEVFVMEQKCIYQDVDLADKKAYHIFSFQDGEIAAYLRLMDKDEEFENVRIGRVISRKRRGGTGTALLKYALDFAKNTLNADKVEVEAQAYVLSFYEKLGFEKISDEFLDAGIPHIKMICKL